MKREQTVHGVLWETLTWDRTTQTILIVTSSALLILPRHKRNFIQITGCRTTDLSATTLFVIQDKETAAAFGKYSITTENFLLFLHIACYIVPCAIPVPMPNMGDEQHKTPENRANSKKQRYQAFPN